MITPSRAAATRDDLRRSIPRTRMPSGDSRGRVASVATEPRVCPGIKQVGDQAPQGHEDAPDYHAAYDEGVIARADCSDDRRSQPRPGEDLLDEERAGEEGRKCQPDQSDDGKKRVSKRMAPKDLAPGK